MGCAPNVGAGIVTASSGLWGIYTYLYRLPDPPDKLTTAIETVNIGPQGDVQLGGQRTVNNIYGLPPDQLAELQRKYVLTDAALNNFLKILGEKPIAAEELDHKLREFADKYQQLKALINAAASDDPRVNDLKRQAREALDRADFPRAKQLLKEALAVDAEAEEKLKEGLHKRALSQAESLAQLGLLEYRQLDIDQAVNYIRQAVAKLPIDADEEQVNYLVLQGRMLLWPWPRPEGEQPLKEALAIVEKAE